MRRIFSYLKMNNITDILTINRLLVSAFVAYNEMEVKRNKLIKTLLIADGAYEQVFLSQILKLIEKYDIKLGLEILINLFEFVISPSDRVITGAIYTPKDIRRKIIKTVFADVSADVLENGRIADISCGCGGFLIDAAIHVHERTGKLYRDIFRDNIYGIDIEEYSIERSRILLSLLALLNGEDEEFEFNLLVSDTLDYTKDTFDINYQHFDFILGNPPYVCSRNMSAETREKIIDYEVCRWGHPDLYIPFIQIATEMLNEGGRMGLITMNSFLNSLNGRGLREFLSRGGNQVNIADFRSQQIFRSKSTYTCLFFLVRTKSDVVAYSNVENKSLDCPVEYEDIKYDDLDSVKGWNLNGFAFARKIESTGVPLGQFCKSRHGIATLSNKAYIFKPSDENENFFYLKLDNNTYPIERGICRDIVNSNKLNSKQNFEELIEKVIFPYHIDENGRVEVINEAEMAIRFPHTYSYLQSQRKKLAKRDKGHTEDYPAWYAFGRTQSLTMPRYKLFFPKIANKSLHCTIMDDPNLLLYNGMAFVSDNLQKLEILKRFLESDTFWTYVNATAKPYASGYSSLNGVNIMKFGIPELNDRKIDEFLRVGNAESLNKMIKRLYFS